MKTIRANELPSGFFLYKGPEETMVVTDIIRDVKEKGDKALLEYTEKFDKVRLDSPRVSGKEIARGSLEVGSDLVAAIKRAASNIEEFSAKQKERLADFEHEIEPGVFTGQKVVPVERAGVYVPGGRFPLVSTVLMCVIPAKAAGVSEIAICTPPDSNGRIHPAILAAANICGVDEIYKAGGAQAVAAMAYGTESIGKTDIIVGPGNKYVAAAKKEVYGVVGIDFIAGPSEVLIIADESADPGYIAADLLAQAEHDPDAAAILVTDSEVLAEKVVLTVKEQLKDLKTKSIARESIDVNGLIVLVDDLKEAVEISNRKAPEHLEVQIAEPNEIISSLRNYGSMFIGKNSAEVFGDYSSGVNHTLPTNLCARYTGGLSVLDFLKVQTTLRVEDKGLERVRETATVLAEAEGLDGHCRAAKIRKMKNG